MNRRFQRCARLAILGPALGLLATVSPLRPQTAPAAAPPAPAPGRGEAPATTLSVTEAGRNPTTLVTPAPVASPASQPTSPPPAGANSAGGSGVNPAAGPGAAAAPANSIRPGATGRPGDATRPGTRPAPVAGNKISMRFENAAIDTVLEHLSAAAGFNIVKPTTAGPTGTVSILAVQPVTPEEAVDLLNAALADKGFTAVRQERILKIVTRETASTMNIPVIFTSDPEQIKPTDELITVVVPLLTVDAARLRQDLTPLLPAKALVTANSGSNTIIITDAASSIRRVVEIIKSLDSGAPQTKAEMWTYTMKNGDAASAAKLVTTIFQAEQQNRTGSSGSSSGFTGFGGRGSSGFQGFGGGGFPGGGFPSSGGGFSGFGGGRGSRGGGGRGEPGDRGDRGERGGGGEREGDRTSGEVVVVGKVTAASDDRTNTLVVTAPHDTLEQIKQVVRDLDESPITESAFFIYPLKNADAQELEFVLNTIFGGGGSGYGGGRSTTTSSGRTGARTQYNNSALGTRGASASRGGGTSGRGASGGSFGSRSGSSIGATSLGSSFGFGSFGGAFGLSPGSSATASGMSGQVFVVADPATNSLIISTPTRLQTQVGKIISELDRARPQVVIKVLIAEVTHDDTVDVGVDFSVLNQRASGNGQSGGTNFGVSGAGAPTNGLVVQLLENNVNATLRALQSQGKLDVLSRPYILASDNQLASITVGNEVPFITSSRITDNGQTINTVEYEDVGIILNVTPHINPDGLVILDVAPEISQLTGTTIPISNNVGVPVIAKRAAESRVAIMNGNTIVIGGLMEDRKTSTINKVPLLGDLPLFGPLFTRTQTTKSKTELLIFLTPHVAQSPTALSPMSRDEMEGTTLTPHAVEPGTFQEQIRGLQRGRTAPAEGSRLDPASPAIQGLRREPTSIPMPVLPNREGDRSAPQDGGPYPDGFFGPPYGPQQPGVLIPVPVPVNPNDRIYLDPDNRIYDERFR